MGLISLINVPGRNTDDVAGVSRNASPKNSFLRITLEECRTDVGCPAFPAETWLIASNTCREVLAKVGDEVSRAPFKQGRGQRTLASTKRALALRPPLPSDAHFKTKRAFITLLWSTEAGSVSISQTPFSKMLESSAFLPSRKVRRSSSDIRRSLRSALSFTCFLRGAFPLQLLARCGLGHAKSCICEACW